MSVVRFEEVHSQRAEMTARLEKARAEYNDAMATFNAGVAAGKKVSRPKAKVVNEYEAREVIQKDRKRIEKVLYLREYDSGKWSQDLVGVIVPGGRVIMDVQAFADFVRGGRVDKTPSVREENPARGVKRSRIAG